MNREARGTLWSRLVRGHSWVWLSEDYRAALPTDLGTTVMGIVSRDRLHAKQGRSTARVRFDSPWGPLSVYLKRHERLPLASRIAAWLFPRGRHTPASAEMAHLQRARSLGLPVPDVVAAGESIGPWGKLHSFLMVAELSNCVALNECLPQLAERMPYDRFRRLKRELVIEMAGIVARLHQNALFHKDLYLCHFFLDPTLRAPQDQRLTLIDFHRLGEHRFSAPYWRWKDLGQLLFSTFDLPEIDDRDRLRFWTHYQRTLKLRAPRVEQAIIQTRAARYLAHDRVQGARRQSRKPRS